MLDQETKKRIFDSRNILVGKIPDPKAQVEQITTALIYKFMADMDYESEELGGEPLFFIGEYKKYTWSNLVDTRLGGEERFNLYVEALEKMPQNPSLPQLFRNMLKNAFLPYRDPETLRLFLKKINEFTYDHSEKLGDAFEYLLSVLDSQGDAGQFRTPRHIIDFIVAVLDPKKDETILDPACGTAGFLISSYKHILRQNGIKTPGDQLTPDEKTKLMNNFTGYDISPDMVRLSLVNMYLHNFPNPITHEYDTLTSEERWDEMSDIIMANPPFMNPTGGIRPHKRFSIQAKKSEILFVDYIAEHLNIYGRAGVIVPEGIITSSGQAYKSLRKLLVEKYLYAVVSLPGGVFNPYSAVKTCILFMDKQLAKKTSTILFIKIENDGFDLGAQRREINKNDLPQALSILNRYKYALQEKEEFSSLLRSEVDTNLAIIVKKTRIIKNINYNLSGEKYKEAVVKGRSIWPMIDFEQICTLEYGSALPERERILGEYPVVGSNGITGWHNKCLVEGPAIIVGRKGSAGEVVWIDKSCFPIDTTYYVKLNPKIGADKRFLYYMLKGMNLQELRGGGAVPGLNRNDVYETKKIPLPSIETQREIVTELDNYQKIIDGAKQVVANYRPQIKIDPKWTTISLGKICEFRNGINYTQESSGERVKILGVKDFQNNFSLEASSLDYITADGKLKENDLLKEGDIVFVRSNGNPNLIGRCLLVRKVNERIVHSGFTIRLTLNSKEITPMFLTYLLKMDFIRKKMVDGGTGANIKSLNQGVLSDLVVPIPPLEIQEQIISQIEEEQELVEANKKLIELFEQKIKDKLAEVWGYGDATIKTEVETEEDAIEEREETQIEEPEIKQEALFTSF